MHTSSEKYEENGFGHDLDLLGSANHLALVIACLMYLSRKQIQISTRVLYSPPPSANLMESLLDPRCTFSYKNMCSATATCFRLGVNAIAEIPSASGVPEMIFCDF